MQEPVIIVSNVSKKYEKGKIGYNTLRRTLQSKFAKLLKRPDPNQKIGEEESEFFALKNLSLSVRRGERVAVIGKNGAGKTTLLKMLSGVTTPTAGEVRIRGKLAGLLEVGTGFHPELTGRENVLLSGTILGMRKKEVVKKMDEIVAFSECEEFIDTPVKRYSSGMCVRLAFAVALFLPCEIMLLDEVLSVADEAFKHKAIGAVLSLAEREERTLLCVSHDRTVLNKLCTRGVVLQNGKVAFDGDLATALDFYGADTRS